MMIRSLLTLAPLFFLMPDGGGGGGGMAQPMPAAPPVAAGGTPPVQPEKPFADNDFTPAAMKWRSENNVQETLPTSTGHEPEGGGATAASASVPQGVEEGDNLPEKQNDLTPAPNHFSHVSGAVEHDEDEARRANKRTGRESDTEHEGDYSVKAAKPPEKAPQKDGKADLEPKKP